MESLGKIFGSTLRVKIMRLFLFNEKTSFDIDDVVLRSRGKKPDTRKELVMLEKIGFLKKKNFTKKVEIPTRKKEAKKEYKRVKLNGWILNTRFDLTMPLRELLLNSELIKQSDIAKKIKKSGKIELLVLSGLFIENDNNSNNRKLDILIVGEKIKKDILENQIAIIESEIGHELRYSFFDKKEYEYRISMYDKLVRDVMEYPHIKIIDKQ